MKQKIKITTVFALFVLAVAVLMSVVPGLFTSYDPLKTDAINRLLPPSSEHICGTDELGRDIWSRVVYGTRNSLSVGFGAAALALLLGVEGHFLSSFQITIIRNNFTTIAILNQYSLL